MASIERTLVIVKPDAVERGLVGAVIGRLEQRGLKIVALQLQQISRELAENHYGEHRGKPFFSGLVDYITASPTVTMVLEGPDAIAVTRQTVGATRPAEAAPGTIRADYGLTVGRNLVHASDSPASAEREIGLFFGDQPILSYERSIDRWIVDAD